VVVRVIRIRQTSIWFSAPFQVIPELSTTFIAKAMPQQVRTLHARGMPRMGHMT
jgi:hypothetical protein